MKPSSTSLFLSAVLLAAGLLASSPSPAAAQSWPNEPSGSTVLTDYAYNSMTGSGWGLSGAWGVSLGSDPSAPLSPSNVLQMRFPPGLEGGRSTGNSYFPVGNLTELYAGFWWKPSTNWEGGSGGQKISFIQPSGSWNLVFLLNAASTGLPYKVNAYYPNSAGVNNCHLSSVWGDCPGSVQIFANASNPTISLGVWHRMEMYVKKSSSPTSRDGILRWWIDGVLCANYTNVNYPAENIVQFEFDPTWGNVGETKTAAEHYFWYDHVHLSTGGSGSIPKSDTAPPSVPSGLRAN